MTENYLQSLALKLTETAKTEEEKIEKIYRFVKEGIKYKITVIGDSEEILRRGYGSCIDQSLLLSELLKSIGIKSRYHVILVDFDLIFKKFFLAKFIPFYLRPHLYFHVFNEVYSEGKWKKLDPSLDSDIEELLRARGVASKEKECCVPPEYISKDLGNFNSFSDILAQPFLSQLTNPPPSFKKIKRIAQFMINLSNWFLYMKRRNKDKGLRKKETVEDILININRLKGK